MRLIYDLVAFDMSCDCYVALPHGEVSWSVVYDGGISMPRGLKLFSILNSAEHEIYPNHKCWHFNNY